MHLTPYSTPQHPKNVSVRRQITQAENQPRFGSFHFPEGALRSPTTFGAVFDRLTRRPRRSVVFDPTVRRERLRTSIDGDTASFQGQRRRRSSVENILRSTFHPQDQSNISAEGLAAQMEGLGLGGINSTTPANPRSRRHSESRNTRPRFEQSFVAEERPRESFWNPFQRPQRSQSHRRSQSANRPTPATAHTPSASTTRYRQADPLTEREGNNPNRIHEGSSREEILFGPETLRDFEQFYRDYDNRVPFEASGIVYMQTPYATGLFDHTTGKSHHLYHPAKAVKHSPSLEHIFVLTPEEGIETLIR